MNGLTLVQETALVICYMHQNDINSNFSDLGISRAFVTLRDLGMIRMTTDWNQELVLFQGMMPAGVEHYDKARSARRSFRALDDGADELMMVLAT